MITLCLTFQSLRCTRCGLAQETTRAVAPSNVTKHNPSEAGLIATPICIISSSPQRRSAQKPHKSCHVYECLLLLRLAAAWKSCRSARQSERSLSLYLVCVLSGICGAQDTHNKKKKHQTKRGHRRLNAGWLAASPSTQIIAPAEAAAAAESTQRTNERERETRQPEAPQYYTERPMFVRHPSLSVCVNS